MKSKLATAAAELNVSARPDENLANPKVLPFRGNVPMRRVSFYLPEPLYEDIQQFADERGDSMTGVLRWSLGIGKAVWDEIKNGHKIRVYKATDDSTQKELIFGRY